MSIEELFAKYSESVYRTCVRYTNNPDDAADLVQETFIKVEGSLSQFKGDSGYFTWIYRIAINECLQFLRKNRRKVRLDENEHKHVLVLEGLEKPVETKLLLDEILSLFDDRTRKIVFLTCFEGLDQEETAEMVGISRRAVVERLTKFREKAAKYMLKECE
ncbi:MAG: RNA polymerase sigma factor [Fibrobacteres bacterium]|nr:RNA polymerase sigma factor [Fibrobacterota bacterium]